MSILLPQAYSAGISCTGSLTGQEQLICANPQLIMLDAQLNKHYEELKSNKIFRLIQKDWLENDRSHCQNEDCLFASYNKQLLMLTPQQEERYISSHEVLNSVILATEGYSLQADSQHEWQRYPLLDVGEEFYIIDVTVINNVVYVIYATNYEGVLSIYEYADNRDIPFLIVRSPHIPLAELLYYYSGKNKYTGKSERGFAKENVLGNRYAGIEDDRFYYYQPTIENGDMTDKGHDMVYQLGSQSPPRISDRQNHIIIYKPFISLYSRAIVRKELHGIGESISEHYYVGGTDQLVLEYENGGVEEVTKGTRFNPEGWSIANYIWHPYKPVLYFDNSGSYACIWRVDLMFKTLTKIVPEHEASDAHPFFLLGHEAIVYQQEHKLMFAISSKGDPDSDDIGG